MVQTILVRQNALEFGACTAAARKTIRLHADVTVLLVKDALAFK